MPRIRGEFLIPNPKGRREMEKIERTISLRRIRKKIKMRKMKRKTIKIIQRIRKTTRMIRRSRKYKTISREKDEKEDRDSMTECDGVRDCNKELDGFSFVF